MTNAVAEDRPPDPKPGRWRVALGNVASSLAMGLFPGRCAACDEALPWRGADEALCETCAHALLPTDGPRCPRCGQGFTSAQAVDHVCGRCHAEPPPYERLLSAWLYGGPAREAILRFKLQGRPYLYRALSRPLADLLLREAWRPDLVLAVPMSTGGLRRRGYDPAYLLALGLSQHLGWPRPPTGLLHKVRETPAQRGMSAAARRENVRGAYQCPEKAAKHLKGRTVLLVDDVVTTGATAEACAGALRRAGVARVSVVTLARTPYD
jgi:ComF family protein